MMLYLCTRFHRGKPPFRKQLRTCRAGCGIFVSGDRAIFRKCRFPGLSGPLYTYGYPTRQYYEDCYIEGTVDFIFGKATAVFNRCQIHSRGKGYVTAPATPKTANMAMCSTTAS